MIRITSLLFLTVLASSAMAGTQAGYSGKGSKAVQPVIEPGCECFAPGFSMGLYGGGMFPRSGGSGVGGGGVLGEYFFTENFGFQGSYGLYATDSEHHQFDGSLVLRFPIKSICLAPYLIGGGGVASNSETRGDYHVGAGIDLRFPRSNCMGLFADTAYHFAAEDGPDFVVARLGVKFRF